MKRVSAGVLVLAVACGKFGTDGEDKPGPTSDAGPDTGVATGATDADVSGGTLVCPPNHFVCEPFDTSLDPAKWSKYKADDLDVTTEPVASRGRVLVSAVSGAPAVDDQGARVTYDLGTDKPIVIELDLKVDPPILHDGGGANNFRVLVFGNANIKVSFYVTKDGLIQFNSGLAGDSVNYTPHAINSPHLKFGEWVHYVIKATLATNGSLELTRGTEILAQGTVEPAAPAEQSLTLGVARNNDFYDLHAEYDNLVVYPQ